MSGTNQTCVVVTRNDYRAPSLKSHYLQLPASVFAFTESITKQVKIISRSASLAIFYGSVGTSELKVARCVLLFLHLEGGWCETAGFETNHK